MQVLDTKLPGVLIIEPKVFGDSRGYFYETFQLKRYSDIGLPQTWVQDNLSFSSKGIIRGLHLQNPYPQGKLVSVLKGRVFDVAVDVRLGSPHYGQWVGVILDDENKRQLYIPPGFAHGFAVMTDGTIFSYKCTDYYHPECELSIIYDDSDLGITWPVENPIVSKKDSEGTPFKSLPRDKLIQYQTNARLNATSI
jgi:dTDP-4-dehydrorhamnose 3,5-epimerase